MTELKIDDKIINTPKIQLENLVIEKYNYKLLFEGINRNFLYNNIKWKNIIENITIATFKYIRDTIKVDDLIKKNDEIKESKNKYDCCVYKGYKTYDNISFKFDFLLLEIITKTLDEYNGFYNKYISKARLDVIFIRIFRHHELEQKNVFAYHNLSGFLYLVLIDYYYYKIPLLNFVYYKKNDEEHLRYDLSVTQGTSADVIIFLDKIKPYLKNHNEEIYKEVYEVECNLYNFFNETNDKRNCRIEIEKML